MVNVAAGPNVRHSRNTRLLTFVLIAIIAMFTKSVLAAVAAASSLVSAQTWTKCNPLTTTCPADPAFGSQKVNCDFSKGACSAFQLLSGPVSYGGNGALFSIAQQGQGPTIATGNYLFFGRVDVVLQAAPGKGIVTAFVLQSDDLDEIDWEWVGFDNAQAQSNYFSKGDTSTYDRGAFHAVSNPTGSAHTYSIEWTSKAVNWLIDGTSVRTLTYEQAKGGSGYPQSPMQVKLGTWVAGRPDASPGTVQWAGGYADWSQAPFNAYFKTISIVDYAGADSPGKNAKQYVYGDHSGSYKSIRVQ
ncbi:glycosidase crf1 [Purpureocillium lavendulum]|uniref:chitinase n=1 Tax=Purpureocillium lavendulum TaxID=1247861 RepID=A0AB34G8I1_9HYPO|nr:glycosidase crf1 [Purpureocillium lavendulum]